MNNIIILKGKGINKIENLPINLQEFYCSKSQITKIENLPIIKYKQFPSLKILISDYILSNNLSNEKFYSNLDWFELYFKNFYG